MRLCVPLNPACRAVMIHCITVRQQGGLFWTSHHFILKLSLIHAYIYAYNMYVYIYICMYMLEEHEFSARPSPDRFVSAAMLHNKHFYLLLLIIVHYYCVMM